MDNVMDATSAEEIKTHEEYLAEENVEFEHLLEDITNAKDLIASIENDLRDLKEITDDASLTVEKLKLLQEHTNCKIDGNDDTPPAEEPIGSDTPTAEEPVIDDDDEITSPPAPLLEPIKIKYAPVIRPVSGVYNLCCISLVWEDNPGVPLEHVRNMGKDVAKIYSGLSNGAVKFNVDTMAIKVNFTHDAKNLAKAEAQAKKIASENKKNGKYHLFAIVHNKVRNFSNGGGDTAHLYGTLTRDALHELGHTRVFKLGHAGRYVDGKLEAYGDGTSFMSKYSSFTLNAPQLYFLGWLPPKKVAMHELNDPAIDYDIELLSAKNSGDHLKVVLIPREGRDLYLSSITIDKKNLFALHLAENGGSQRLAVFGQKSEYDGLFFEKVSNGDNFSTVRIGPKPTP